MRIGWPVCALVLAGCTQANPVYGVTQGASTGSTTATSGPTGSVGPGSTSASTSSASADTTDDSGTTESSPPCDQFIGGFCVLPCIDVAPSDEPHVAIGDVLRDGNPDVVVVIQDFPPRLQLLAGDGEGGLSLADEVGSNTSRITDVVVADLDADGYEEMIASRGGGSEIVVFNEQSLGVPVVSSGTSEDNPFALAVGDVQTGGSLEIVVVERQGSAASTVESFSATAQSLATTTVGAGAEGVALADFDGDGSLDFITADRNEPSGVLRVGLGIGTGDFQTQTPIDAGGRPMAVATGDFDGDGLADYAAVKNGPEAIIVGLGNGTGAFGSPIVFEAPGQWPNRLAVSDLDGDGRDELLVAYQDDAILRAYSGFTEAAGELPVTWPLPANGWDVAVGDLDRDGLDDVVATVPGDPARVCPILSVP